jgi:hydrogenase maturation factor
MCLLVPGKLIEIEEDAATVDYGSEKRVGKLLSKEFKVGDFVIIQGGIIALKIPKHEALRALSLYRKAVSQSKE